MGSGVDDQVAAAVGHHFPGSRTRLEAVDERLVREAIGAPAPAPDAPAHPLMVFVAGLDVGIDLGELFALFGATAADGPMLGEWSMVLDRPLRVGAEYAIRGRVVDVVRKHGARAGSFDIATMLIEVVADGGRVDAQVRTSFVFPRRADDTGR